MATKYETHESFIWCCCSYKHNKCNEHDLHQHAKAKHHLLVFNCCASNWCWKYCNYKWSTNKLVKIVWHALWGRCLIVDDSDFLWYQTEMFAKSIWSFYHDVIVKCYNPDIQKYCHVLQITQTQSLNFVHNCCFQICSLLWYVNRSCEITNMLFWEQKIIFKNYFLKDKQIKTSVHITRMLFPFSPLASDIHE